MPFVAPWMDPEIIITSEVRMRKTNNICYNLYVESNKNDTKHIHKTTGSKISKPNLYLLKGRHCWGEEMEEEIGRLGLA